MRPMDLWETIEQSTGRSRPMVVTIPEFANILDISRITAYRMAALPPEDGGVEVVKLLGTKRIPVSEIFRLMKAEPEAVMITTDQITSH